jgi:ABC-type uncharacterized transport system substrate-binding protein
MKRSSILRAVSLVGIIICCYSNNAFAQSGVTLGQQIAVLKALKPNLEVIGVISGNISEKDVSSLTRAAMQQGIKLFVAQPTNPREIPELYKKLVKEKKAQIILLPNSDDQMVLKLGYDYLKENTVLDKIGMCVPDQTLLSQGALCYFCKENGKLTVYLNQRVSVFVGIDVPKKEENSIIDYVLR